MGNNKVPSYNDLLWPTLEALKTLDGSASIQELSEHITDKLALDDETLNLRHKNGSVSEVDYRAAWARTCLKWIGAVENPARGIWTITEVGRRMPEKVARDRVRRERMERHKKSKRRPDSGRDPRKDDAENEHDWKHALLEIVRRIPPDAFERLCKRVLLACGFIKVEVTGRSGDGGIDGAGVLRVNLLSFHVRFQCKRYAGSVGAREIRDFRGAMVGRADKGLFVTTGGFTKDAQSEAVRDGAPAIDLIDGSELCDLLKDHELGVATETVEVVRPNADFFAAL